MKRFVLTAAFVAISLLASVGCRSGQPVKNYQESSVPAGRAVTLEEVTKTIVSAGAGLGWDMKVVSLGHIVGTLNLRSHTAVVDIPYTTTNYSINYASSENLKYDAADNTIHPNYNGWVQNLNNAIRSRLASL